VHQKRKRKKKKEKKEAALHLRAISQYILYSLGGTPADKTITLHHFSYQLTSRWYLSAQGKIYMRKKIHLSSLINNKRFLRKIPEGIRLHRFIDQYTDTHAVVNEGKKILSPYFGKYNAVVMDIFAV